MLPLVAGAVAGIAGMYFLHGQGKAPKANRQKVKGWILKAKGEVLEQLEKAQEMDEKAYHEVVDSVMAKYNQLDDSDKAAIEALGKDLKKHWKGIVKDLSPKKKKKPTAKK